MSDSSGPVVAAFDLDGTITKGGSVFHWLRHLAGNREVFARSLPLLGGLVMGAIFSGAWADRTKERLFRAVLAGRDESDVRHASRDFALEHLQHEGRPEIVARLAWHLGHGHDVVIVSASPQLYVDVVTEALGATGGLGTRLEVDEDGRLTGGYEGRNCRGAEKMARLDAWIAQRPYETAPIIYAYGNSRGDRRLLAGATFPFDVGRVGRLGALRRYPRLSN